MKLSIICGALLLSASPAVGQDVVVLECSLTINATLIDPETSNVVDSHKYEQDSPACFTVDFKNKTLNGGGQTSEPVEIKDDQLIFEKRKDGGNFNLTIKINPPRELLATSQGAQLINGKLFKISSRFTGTYTRFNQ